MSMLNHAAVEALCSATYLENYLDCMENLPDDLQRLVSQLRELDSNTNELVSDIMHQKDVYVNHEDGAQKKKALIAIQRKLIKSQELGDEKLALVSWIIEHVENRTRQLEQDLENLDPGMTLSKEPEDPVSTKQISTPIVSKTIKQPTTTSTPVVSAVSIPVPMQTLVAPPSDEKMHLDSSKLKRQRRQRTALETCVKDPEKKIQPEDEDKPKKKKKRKAKKEKIGEKTSIDPPIDPDEPTYCLCDQVSYGEMIGCDNDRCIIEWFHFNCVSLTHKPKGKWFCPKCRGDKPTVMRPDLLEALKREKSKTN